MAVPGQKSTKQFLTISTCSDKDVKVYCQSCEQDGSKLPAYGYCTNCSEHLCETCFTVHKRHKLSRHHILLDKASMPQTMSPVTKSQSDNLTKPCPKHNIEMIKYYCHDHKALLCSVCVTLEHTPTSCKVNYIPDVSDQVINSQEYHDMIKEIDDIIRYANTTLQDIKGKEDTSSRSLTDALTNFKTFRPKINQRLDKLEKRVEEAANIIQKENRTTTRVETECKDLSKALQASSDAIEHFNISKQANDLFMELRHAEKMIKDYRQSLATLTRLDFKEYRFEPNKAILNMLKKEKSLGTLTSRPFNLYLKSREISHIDQIYVKTSKDNDDCWISGMTLLTPSHLIITDYLHMAVKMIDINRKSVLNQEKLNGKPWDVSSVSHDEIAVTMPDKQAIQFMSVSGNNFKKTDTLKVHGDCRGISCHDDKMVLSFIDPGKIQILLVNGTVLQTIQDDNIFKRPLYVSTSDNYIYVSDYEMRTITKLTWQCEVEGKYDCMIAAYGLMSDDGALFVCFYNDNTIREISRDFTKQSTVIKYVRNPQAVCWSGETCTLYTSSRTFSGDYDKNKISLFKLTS